MKDGKVLGFACAVSSSTIWGLTIIYWKALVPIDSIVIMLYRIVLVSITMLFVNLKVFNRKELVETLKSKENIKAYLLGGILISASWAINIWGVNSNEILQTSLGFYLEPLIIAAIGLLFFKERFTKLILISFLFALIGVGGMIISYGKIPMFALSLAGTYAAYAVIKRNTNSPIFMGLFYESTFLIPLALPVIIIFEANGKGALAHGDVKQILLLLLIGGVTAIPLGLFGVAARKADFTVLGITAYLDPTISLLLGIFLYKEQVNFQMLVGFIAIWIGIIFFTVDQIRRRQNSYSVTTQHKCHRIAQVA